MAIFSDNDRSKVNEEVDIDEVDEVEDQDDDQDTDTDDQKKDKSPDKKPDAEKDKDQDDETGKDTKKTDPKDDKDSAEYWKNKFSESTRENQVERERREAAERKAEELAKPKEITDETMKQKYPDWDNYDDAVKSALKGQVKLEQEVTTLKQSQSEYHNERKWQGQVDSFLAENTETEKYPIKDTEAFKKYCNKPANKGINLDVLAGAFVFEVGSTDTKPEPKKGSLFEGGSGQGATGKHKSDGKKKYTADDAKLLREQNPREYERKVRSGELVIDI